MRKVPQAPERVEVRRIDGVRWHVAAAFAASAGFRSLATLTPDWRPADGGDRADRRQRWSTVLQLPGADVFLKYYLPRSVFERIKYLLRPSRASAEWRNARQLAALGIRVPALLAWGERRGPGGWRQSLLVTESLDGAPTLMAFSRGPASAKAVRTVRRKLAVSVAAMHEHGLFHRDLHGDNVLVDLSGEEPVPCLLDFHEMLRLPRPVNRFCIDDLARLNGFVDAARWQRFRFLRDYLAARGMHRSQWRDWLVAVDRATRALWDYYDGKGRDYRLYD